MSEQVQLSEGVWLTRDGEHVEVRARDMTGNESSEWRWEGRLKNYLAAWRNDGTLNVSGGESNGDLVQFLRALPGAEPAPAPAPAPEPQPVEVRAGIWQTREGHAVEVRKRDANGPTRFRWEGLVCGVRESWRDDGTWSVKDEIHRHDLVEYVGRLPQQTTTDTLAEIEEGMTEIERDVAELVQQDEACTLQAELALVTSERETLRADLTEVASERDALVREINEVTATRDSLEQQLAATTAERDILAQRLVTKASEEALQKQVAKQQIEINTLKDHIHDMTDDRETLRRQFAAMTADRDRVQAELAIAIESLQNERFQAQQAHAGCKRAEELLADMTAERDRLTAEAAGAQRLAADLRGEVDFVRGQKTAQEHQLRAEIDRLERELRQARIEIDAEKEAPANNCRAIAEGHLIGAQSGRHAAFEAVERWLEPLAGVDSEHAAAVLQALPGCIRKLAELEGVTW